MIENVEKNGIVGPDSVIIEPAATKISAAYNTSLYIAAELGPGKTVVTVFPDRGERYFSTTQYFEF